MKYVVGTIAAIVIALILAAYGRIVYRMKQPEATKVAENVAEEQKARVYGASQVICANTTNAAMKAWKPGHPLPKNMADVDVCNRIQIGMNKSEVEARMMSDEPGVGSAEHSSSDDIVDNLTITTWVYRGEVHGQRHMLRFENGILTSVSTF